MTGATLRSVEALLPALDEVYRIRNILAHSAGTCSAADVAQLKIVKAEAGKRLRIGLKDLLANLATPCLAMADALDAKVPIAK